jgi:hypothetical protein
MANFLTSWRSVCYPRMSLPRRASWLTGCLAGRWLFWERSSKTDYSRLDTLLLYTGCISAVNGILCCACVGLAIHLHSPVIINADSVRFEVLTAVAVKIWSRVAWWKRADISEYPATSIIRVVVDPDLGGFPITFQWSVFSTFRGNVLPPFSE